MASNLSSEEHGGIDPAELKRLAISPGHLIDFSVNSNPFGPSPRVLEAIHQVDFSQYPDRNCTELSTQLADLNVVQESQILVGNGTAELIWLVAHALLQPGDPVLIVGPTFGEYRRATTRIRAEIVEIRAQPPDFSPPIDQVVEYIQSHRPKLVFLCNPNNPTGKYIQDGEMARVLAACGKTTRLVLDQAYRAFVDGRFFSDPLDGNGVVLRSMTKDFALAGLRLGYAIGDPLVIEQLRSFQPAWSVNSFAQAAGLAALSDLAYYREALAELRQLRDRFFIDLKTRGGALVDSDVHFTLLHSDEVARQLRLRLLQSSLQVRDCASFELPDYIRISTQLAEDNQRLLDRLFADSHKRVDNPPDKNV